MDNKYFRVKQTDSSSSFRHTLRIKQAVQQKKYLYLDLSDDRKVSLHTENHLKQLQNSQPDKQEEVTEYIGNHHIGGVHQLSFKTSQMLQYLSENKIVNQQRRQIDEIVRNRISKQKHFVEQNYQRKKSRSRFKIEKKQSKNMRFSLDSPELEKYLESKKTEQIYRSLAQKEKQLQHSVSGTGDSFISDRMKVLIAKENTEISLPQIKSVHLKKMRKR